MERLRIAGANQTIFSPEAAQLVHRYSRGIPRTINLICEHALILGYVEQIPLIPGPLIDHVAEDLELTMSSFLMAPAAVGAGGYQAPLHPMETGANRVMNSFHREPGRSGQ